MRNAAETCSTRSGMWVDKEETLVRIYNGPAGFDWRALPTGEFGG